MLLRAIGLECGYDSRGEVNSDPLIYDLDLSLRESEILTVFGSNGTGKTTLLNLFAGFPLPASFWIRTSELTIQNSGEVGYVQQTPSAGVVSWLSGLENMLFPIYLKEGTWTRAVQKVGEGTINRIDALFGGSLPLDKKAGRMSGGEVQSTVIARELIYAKSVLLLDEAVSAIDHRRRLSVVLGLREYARDARLGVISVSHNLEESVLFSDRILILAGGSRKNHVVVAVERGPDWPNPRAIASHIEKIARLISAEVQP